MNAKINAKELVHNVGNETGLPSYRIDPGAATSSAAGSSAASPDLGVLNLGVWRQPFFITVWGCVKLAWRHAFSRVQTVQEVARITDFRGPPRAVEDTLARAAVRDCGWQ